MTDPTTLATFTPLLGRPFFLDVAGAPPVAVTLIEARAGATDNDPRRTRAPFELIFRTPAGAAFQQGTYRISEESLGELDMFLVPIVPDAGGPRLQAIFG